MKVDGLLLHVTIRCNNQEFYFKNQEDFRSLIFLMKKMSDEQRIFVYDYVLMSNHCHWLLSQRGGLNVSSALGWVFGQYARQYNKKYKRKGHFWESRYRTTLIEENEHALVCMRYIARNPVRAGIVLSPEHYLWSGYRHYAGIIDDPLLVPHPVYLGLGPYPKRRIERYRQFVEFSLRSEHDVKSHKISGSFAYGSKAFIANLRKKGFDTKPTY